jgi:hypothetical protein
MFWSAMLSNDHEPEAIKDLVMAQSILGISGFTRTDQNLSFQAQFESDPLPPIPEGATKYDLEKMIDVELTLMIKSGIAEDAFKSEKDWRASLFRFMTSKSAGVGKSGAIEYEVKLPVKTNVIRGLGDDGDLLSVKQSSKRMVFMANPTAWTSKHLMHLPMDADNPGGTADRSVTQGKASRAINIQPLATITGETYVAPFLR